MKAAVYSGIGFVCVLGVLLIAYCRDSIDARLLRHFEKLANEMTRGDVEALLGEPTPGVAFQWDEVRSRKDLEIRCWMGESYTIAVAFDKDGCLKHKILIDELQLLVNPSIWDKVRRSFRR